MLSHKHELSDSEIRTEVEAQLLQQLKDPSAAGLLDKVAGPYQSAWLQNHRVNSCPSDLPSGPATIQPVSFDRGGRGMSGKRLGALQHKPRAFKGTNQILSCAN